MWLKNSSTYNEVVNPGFKPPWLYLTPKSLYSLYLYNGVIMVSSRNISKISKTIHKILNKRGGLNTFLKDSCLNVHKFFIYGTLANQVRALKYVGLRQVCPSFLPSWSLERGLDLEALFP